MTSISIIIAIIVIIIVTIIGNKKVLSLTIVKISKQKFKICLYG